MKKPVCYFLLFFCLILSSGNLFGEALLGDRVLDFQGVDLKGNLHRLSDYAGKIVVLEWSSPECPYSRRYYENGTLDELYDYAEKNKIVWINIVPRLHKLTKQVAFEHFDVSKKIVILDDDYDLSTTFAAATTPQIFIIDQQGILSYSGAIDSTASFKKTAKKPVAYTRDALDDLLNGREVRKKITRAFGCYVKNNAVIPVQALDGLPPIIPTAPMERGSQ